MIDTFTILLSTLLCVLVIWRASRPDVGASSHVAPRQEAAHSEWRAPWAASGELDAAALDRTGLEIDFTNKP